METLLKNESLKLVQDSYGRCLANGDVLETFYNQFLESSPVIKAKFAKTDFEQQKKLLRHGINLMIMFAADNLAGQTGLKRIRESHNIHHLNISPALYVFWKNCLLYAIQKHDAKFNSEVWLAWNEVLKKGIDYIKSGY